MYFGSLLGENARESLHQGRRFFSSLSVMTHKHCPLLFIICVFFICLTSFVDHEHPLAVMMPTVSECEPQEGKEAVGRDLNVMSIIWMILPANIVF